MISTIVFSCSRVYLTNTEKNWHATRLQIGYESHVASVDNKTTSKETHSKV
jgi:hypothetical protein